MAKQRKEVYPDALDPDALYPMPVRWRLDEYEFLARAAADARHDSIQKILHNAVFRGKWRTKLKAFRAKQRAAGLDDISFYPASAQKALGAKIKTGRRRRWHAAEIRGDSSSSN